MSAFSFLKNCWAITALFIWQSKGAVYRFTFLPIVILTLLGTLVFHFQSFAYDDNIIFRSAFGVLSVTTLIANIALYVMFAVAWHRFFLTPDDNRSVWDYLRWSGQKWRYLSVLSLVLLSVMVMLTLLQRPVFWMLYFLKDVISMTAENQALLAPIENFSFQTIDIIVLAILIVLSVPLARLMLFFPAAAIEEKWRWGDVWQLSSGYSKKLLLLFASLIIMQTILTGSLVALNMLVVGVLDIFAIQKQGLTVYFISEFILVSFYYATIVFLITPLSVAYETIFKEKVFSSGE